MQKAVGRKLKAANPFGARGGAGWDPRVMAHVSRGGGKCQYYLVIRYL